MGYICLKLRGITGKTMGYIMGYNWQIFKFRISYVKTVGYIRLKLWDIFGKNYGIY